MDGFETPFGMELLATVHWVATRDELTDRHAIAQAVWAWGDKKRKFTREQIDIASTVWKSSTGLLPRLER